MSYKKSPPVKVDLDIDSFNCLCKMLTRYTTVDDERIQKIAIRLKEKLLKYSVPRTTEEQEDFVDIRFYPNEASEIICMLVVNIGIASSDINYFQTLLENRESKKQEYRSNNLEL